jgi:hypothetical protein
VQGRVHALVLALEEIEGGLDRERVELAAGGVLDLGQRLARSRALPRDALAGVHIPGAAATPPSTVGHAP